MDLDVVGVFKTLESYTMGFTENLNYVLFKNPVSATVIDSTKYVGNSLWSLGRPVTTSSPAPAPIIPKELQNLAVQRIVFGGTPYIRLAGLSGALAVLFGAYGAHKLHPIPGIDERKRVYETANRYHFIHTLALIGVPLSRHPKIVSCLLVTGIRPLIYLDFPIGYSYYFTLLAECVGNHLEGEILKYLNPFTEVFTVMSAGMILFCGTCYYDAFTGNSQYRKYTPVGGSLLVMGWLCFLL